MNNLYFLFDPDNNGKAHTRAVKTQGKLYPLAKKLEAANKKTRMAMIIFNTDGSVRKIEPDYAVPMEETYRK